jgi:hypothetical protein
LLSSSPASDDGDPGLFVRSRVAGSLFFCDRFRLGKRCRHRAGRVRILRADCYDGRCLRCAYLIVAGLAVTSGSLGRWQERTVVTGAAAAGFFQRLRAATKLQAVPADKEDCVHGVPRSALSADPETRDFARVSGQVVPPRIRPNCMMSPFKSPVLSLAVSPQSPPGGTGLVEIALLLEELHEPCQWPRGA